MRYRILIVKNKKRTKIVLDTASYERVINEFRLILKNNQVDLPKRHTNINAIKPVEIELLLLKQRKDTDKNRMVRDKLGKIVEEKTDNNKWIILDSAPYQIEETFYVYGYDSVHDRFTVRDIIKRILMKGIRSKYTTKQIIIVNNKLIIRDEDMDIIICKCPEDCIRLYNKLKEISMNSRINRLLFMGVATKTTKNDLYNAIAEKTGWNQVKMWRTNTRP